MQRRNAVGLIVSASVAAFLLLAGQCWLIRERSWTHREPPAASAIGINFSCDQAEYLLLEDPALGPAGYVPDDRPGRAEWCAGVLGTLLDQTGVKLVRLSAQWDEVQPARDRYDLSLVEALLDAAYQRGATVSLSVGMKAQRHPEYHIPAWARDGLDLPEGTVVSDVPELRALALDMVDQVVRRLAGHPALDSWGAENEGLIASGRSDDWRLSREYLQQVVSTIDRADPARLPIVINHAQHFVMDKRWQQALEDADVLGQSMYPRRNVDLLSWTVQVNIMELGWLMPNYAHQAAEARDRGKQFWVTELQAEPWTDYDARLITPSEPSENLSPEKFRQNIGYARRSGAERVYLWGAEWWLYQAEFFGDRRWLEVARDASAP